MKKSSVNHISKVLPDFFKNSFEYLKGYYEKEGQEILDKSSGTIGLLIKLFAKPLIDKYYDYKSEKKLENFGYNVYLKSSLFQANESLKLIEDKINDSVSPNLVFEILEKSIKEEIEDFNPKDIILIYQPKYHPAVVFVKKNYLRILKELNTNPNDIKAFLKHFNENIENSVVKEFGDDYKEHLKDTEQYRLQENEITFLWELIEQGKIGFKESENLKYEATFANWKKVCELRENEEENLEKKRFENQENELIPIEKLIEEYFSRNPSNHLEKILFVVADFGKGKSVFMKHYAAHLAKEYLQTAEGYFPVYFNLRNFKNFSSEPNLGVISDYLESKYSIKIDDEYFQKKKYVFLVDSLDESGELNKRTIDKVVSSIKNIQGINKSKYKTNRIIITSRPFDEGLSEHLNNHEPFIIKNKENRDIPYFISAYGFTKKQFNEWLFNSLSSFQDIKKIKAGGYAIQILNAIKTKKEIDIYEELLKNGTLSRSELRRPIFAYMIYQLIINNVDFLAVGKIGIYLSFLNLLTKEAKHINDINYKVNLKEEFEFRNILHSTASLWMYERQRGKQGVLKKADICRVLEGKNSGESDNELLERFKGHGLIEIQFLSHSYFGENDNILHFQHQSFAEILLAEYYLKVLIKYALDDDTDFEEARVKLTLGEPTEQTILFLKEMLGLLRETSLNENSIQIIEKRKLLFPLMASLATKKNNRLFCNDIYFTWYEHCNIDENQTELPQESLRYWCLNEKKINKLIDLAASIMNSKTNYLTLQANTKTALFNNEILELNNQSINSLTSNIDRWIALLAGNILYNDISRKEHIKLFNWDKNINYNHLFDIIRCWNFSFNDSSPSWGKDYFMGLNMQSNEIRLNFSHYDFEGLNFSYSYLKNIRCWSTNWSRSKLNHCTLNNIDFITSLFFGTSILHIKNIIQPFSMSNCAIDAYGIKLLETFRTSNFESFKFKKNNIMERKSFVSETTLDLEFEDGIDFFNTIIGFIIYGLQRSLFTINEIKESFVYENENVKDRFYQKIDALIKFEV